VRLSKFRPNYSRGIAWFLVSLVIGVANDVLMKHLGNEYSSAQIVCLRYGFATLSLALVACVRRKKMTMFLRAPQLHIVRAIMLLSAIMLYCDALTRLPLATVTALNFIIPIFTLVFARAFLGEKITRGRAVATILGFAGVCVILSPTDSEFSTLAACTLLFSSMLFAGLDVVNKRFISGEGTFQMVLYTATITFALSVPFALPEWIWPSLADVALFAALGIGANLLLYCILEAFKKVNVSIVAPLRYLELVIASIAGFFVFMEIPLLSTIFGALMIISSSIYVVISGAKNNRCDK
jgi:drug/metabolite transporter (DMT)-like permease